MSSKFNKVPAKVIHKKILGCNSIEISGHALEQMAIRSVREDQVLDVLQFPDETNLSTQNDRKRYRKSISDHRYADVVFIEKPNEKSLAVITVISIQKYKPRPIIQRRKRS